MRFEKGNKYGKGGAKPGAGRPPKPETVIRNFIKDHPKAYGELMSKLWQQGLEGDITAAQYVCDRLKGRPGVKIDLDIGVKPYDMLIKELELAILQQSIEPAILLKEGTNAIQEPGGTQGQGSGETTEA